MLYVIKAQCMATHLMSMGFKLIKMDVNFKEPDRNVYLFKDTPELRQAMSEYKRKEF